MIGIGLSDSRPQDLAYSSELEQLMENPSAYFIEYNDGRQTTLLMFNGAVRTVLLQLRCLKTLMVMVHKLQESSHQMEISKE